MTPEARRVSRRAMMLEVYSRAIWPSRDAMESLNSVSHPEIESIDIIIHFTKSLNNLFLIILIGIPSVFYVFEYNLADNVIFRGNSSVRDLYRLGLL